MKTLFNIETKNLIKLFNTISHIIYFEIKRSDFSTLRLNVVDLESDRRKIYTNLLGAESIDDKDFGDNFYRIFIPDNYSTPSFSDENKQNPVGNIIYITFIDNIDRIYTYYEDKLFRDSNSKIHLLVPLSLTFTDTKSSKRFEYVQELFKYILFYFAGYKASSIYSKDMVAVSKYIHPLSNLFANLIIDDESASASTLDIVAQVLNNYADTSSNYIKLNINNITELDIENILKLYGI